MVDLEGCEGCVELEFDVRRPGRELEGCHVISALVVEAPMRKGCEIVKSHSENEMRLSSACFPPCIYHAVALLLSHTIISRVICPTCLVQHVQDKAEAAPRFLLSGRGVRAGRRVGGQACMCWTP